MNEVREETIINVGSYDRELELFESQYPVPGGISYNSYVILDEKVAVLDSVDARKTEEWLVNLEQILAGRGVDYLVIHHMEPDHSAGIAMLAERYPEMKLVGNGRTFHMLKQFTGKSYEGRTVMVKERDELELGRHTLTFFMAPMVHWPEVMVSYEQTEKALFSADAFGRFGDPGPKKVWLGEARRYYTNIVGKYGAQVAALLRKMEGLDIRSICPLHGPVLTGETIALAVEKYRVWSSYAPEETGVLVAYASIHGNTARAALEMVELLQAEGLTALPWDLTRQDWSAAVGHAFRYSGMLLMAASYDSGAFTPMAQFLSRLKSKSFRKRTVGLVENSTWAPCAIRDMEGYLNDMEGMTVLEPRITICSTLTEETRGQLRALAAAFGQALK